MNRGKRWTTSEVKLLYSNIPTSDLAEMTGRSEKAIRTMRAAIHAVPHDAVMMPEVLSPQEKEYRIYKLAKQYGIRIQ